MTDMSHHGDYLAAFLEPITPYLGKADVTDVFINGTGALWVERTGGVITRHDAPLLDEDWLWHLARQMARTAHQGISRAEPLLSGTLPCGARFQVVAPPATRHGFAIAFRRQVTANYDLNDLNDLKGSAMFRDTALGTRVTTDGDLAALYEHGDPVAFLAAAVKRRKTILISGGTSTGKTTFVNALLREIPPNERLVAIEDSAELDLAHENAVGLIAARGRLGESGASADELLQASLRLRPDRILLGEVRGAEALTFLRAINTGHPGSLTTIHADTPERAFDQMAMLALQSGANIDQAQLRKHIMELVDIVIQLERRDGVRRVSEIRWNKANLTGGLSQKFAA